MGWDFLPDFNILKNLWKTGSRFWNLEKIPGIRDRDFNLWDRISRQKKTYLFPKIEIFALSSPVYISIYSFLSIILLFYQKLYKYSSLRQCPPNTEPIFAHPKARAAENEDFGILSPRIQRRTSWCRPSFYEIFGRS